MTTEGKVLNNGKPIVAVDIDGTLADYHGYFLEFAEKYLGKEMPPKDKINPGMRLSEFMGIDHDTYRQVKLAYRQGGLKRSMPAFPYAQELCQTIIDAGAELWICTTRPYLRLDNIDPDTREWLDRNEIPYTAMIFGDSKYEDLAESVGPERIVAVIEDLPEMAERAFKCGIKRVIMPDRPYNIDRVISRPNVHQVIRKVPDLDIARKAIVREIERYYDRAKSTENEDNSPTVKYAKDDGVIYDPEVTEPASWAVFPNQDDTTRYGDADSPFPSINGIPLPASQYEIDREDRWLAIADATLELFIRKSRDYGQTGDSLGAKGQFADMWRKFGKIKNQVWDNPDREPDFEGTREILMDLIGHAILFIDYIDQDNKEQQ